MTKQFITSIRKDSGENLLRAYRTQVADQVASDPDFHYEFLSCLEDELMFRLACFDNSLKQKENKNDNEAKSP